ncbi:MAG: ion transporter [Planctomycetales bacterium]|nr:ion transporter [Planctomycetales bacterium]
MAESNDRPARAASWRERWYEIIFEADTPAGKLFDVVLLIAIVLSVLVVMLESVKSIGEDARFGRWLIAAEWFFTLLFTAEYLARLACARRPGKYALSFFGIVDLLAILPTYFMVLSPGAQRLTVVRSFRLLRAFRIFKLAHMLNEATALRRAIWASRSKISVFLAFIVIVVVIVGSAMHLIEGEESGFTSIPQSMYWAIVTMTTVGYGDVAPQTPLGKALAATIMMLGYSMIIVPTGIVTAELTSGAGPQPLTTQVCPHCMAEGHDHDAGFCKFCGGRL